MLKQIFMKFNSHIKYTVLNFISGELSFKCHYFNINTYKDFSVCTQCTLESSSHRGQLYSRSWLSLCCHALRLSSSWVPSILLLPSGAAIHLWYSTINIIRILDGCLTLQYTFKKYDSYFVENTLRITWSILNSLFCLSPYRMENTPLTMAARVWLAHLYADKFKCSVFPFIQ